MSSSSSKTSKKQTELGFRLSICLQREENKLCSDCGEMIADPTWASLIVIPEHTEMTGKEKRRKQQHNNDPKMGIFICRKCCSYHSQLQADYEVVVVKNIKNLVEWSETEVDALESSGNSLVNSIFEKHLPDLGCKPSPQDEDAQADFIGAKYRKHKFVDNEALEEYVQQYDAMTLFKKKKSHSDPSLLFHHGLKALAPANIANATFSLTSKALFKEEKRFGNWKTTVPHFSSDNQQNTDRITKPPGTVALTPELFTKEIKAEELEYRPTANQEAVVEALARLCVDKYKSRSGSVRERRSSVGGKSSGSLTDREGKRSSSNALQSTTKDVPSLQRTNKLGSQSDTDLFAVLAKESSKPRRRRINHHGDTDIVSGRRKNPTRSHHGDTDTLLSGPRQIPTRRTLIAESKNDNDLMSLNTSSLHRQRRKARTGSRSRLEGGNNSPSSNRQRGQIRSQSRTRVPERSGSRSGISDRDSSSHQSDQLDPKKARSRSKSGLSNLESSSHHSKRRTARSRSHNELSNKNSNAVFRKREETEPRHFTAVERLYKRSTGIESGSDEEFGKEESLFTKLRTKRTGGSPDNSGSNKPAVDLARLTELVKEQMRQESLLVGQRTSSNEISPRKGALKSQHML